VGNFYFDESIHPKAKFTLGALVYSERSLDDLISSALRDGGLTPGVEEFKSGLRMDRNPQQVVARNFLTDVFRANCRLGVVLAPDCPRHVLGAEALKGLNKILDTCCFGSESHDVWFDEGILASRRAGERAARELFPDGTCKFHFEQDSVRVFGLQVADLIAHTCATLLLAELGLVNKIVKAGENSGYHPNSGVELSFELWAGLRYHFFAAPPPPFETWKSELDYSIDVASRGLHIADSCTENVKTAGQARFGSMYVGCIH